PLPRRSRRRCPPAGAAYRFAPPLLARLTQPPLPVPVLKRRLRLRPSDTTSLRCPALRADWHQSGPSNTPPALAPAAQNFPPASSPATALACASHTPHTTGNGAGIPSPPARSGVTLALDAALARDPSPTLTCHTARIARAAP